MQVPNAVLYAGMGVLGAAVAVGAGQLFAEGDDARLDKHERKLDAMTPAQMREALDGGGRIQEPWDNGVAGPVAAGLAIGLGGAAAAGVYGLRNAIRYNAEPWSQRGNYSVAAFGAGLLLGGVANDLLANLRRD